MSANRAHVVEMAMQWEHPDYRQVLETLVDLEGGEWYIREKIVKAPHAERRRDNGRVLKYAYNFCRNGGNVTFVREVRDRSGVKTPDLKVAIEQRAFTFYAEVKNFPFQGNSASTYPESKVVDAVRQKRRQLPDSEVGFVAIDNFDLHLELDGRAMTHAHIDEALCELERLATENPNGWQEPSGVIIAASTSGGAFSGPVSIPHLVWMNRYAAPAAPAWLTQWIANSLPDGQIIDARAPATPLEPTARTEDQSR